MAHLRARDVLPVYENLLKFSPLIGVFGHRQVGKTTFLEQVAASYCSLDDAEVLTQARSNSKHFLATLSKKPSAIDESQLAPELFPALKEYVRTHKMPGQIILSGSVRFYSRKVIRESLTGRIVNIDLLPMSLTEISGTDRSRLALKLIQKINFSHDLETNLSSAIKKKRKHLIDAYLECGGLPGICFLRSPRLRQERLRDQLLLILDRDIRLVYPSSVPYIQMLSFVRALAQLEGEPFQPTNIRAMTGLAEATQKKLLHALESVFLLRLITIEGDRKGVCVYFEDQAEHVFLHEDAVDKLRAFEGLVYRNLRTSFNYELGMDFRFFQFRKRPDVRIPFCVKTREGCLGILPILEQNPTRAQLRMAHRFLEHYGMASVLIVTLGAAETKVLEPRILRIPAERLLFD